MVGGGDRGSFGHPPAACGSRAPSDRSAGRRGRRIGNKEEIHLIEVTRRRAAWALKEMPCSLSHKIDYIRLPRFLESDLNDAEATSCSYLVAHAHPDD